MNKLAATAIAMILMLVGSGSVSGTPAKEAQANPAPVAAPHLDPHVGYYEQHLINIGIAKRKQ